METENYVVTTNSNREKEKFVHNTQKDFIVGIEKTYRDVSRLTFTYCVFPLYNKTHDMIMDADFGAWAAGKGIEIKDFEELAHWYLTNYLNYKATNFTLMVDGGRTYGTDYQEINFIHEVYDYSQN